MPPKEVIFREEARKRILKGVDAMADTVKVMIGGAPVTQAFCDEIGADGYAPDAASAADLAKSMI